MVTNIAFPMLLIIAASAIGVAQSPELPASFDVVSIKPSAVTNGNFSYRSFPGGRLSCFGQTLKMLIIEAYGVKAFQISGGPSWVSTALWDLEAKAEGVQGRLPKDRENAMVRSLLAERFQLKVRLETKEMPVFALIIAKGGPKLTPHTGEPVPSAERIRMGRIGTGLLSVKQGRTAILVSELQRQLARTVIDKTGLDGEYDYTLTWAPEPGQGGRESLGLPPRPDAEPLAPADGPSVFTALQEQLGLRLESQKGPVKIVVIDGAEKASEN